MPEHVWLFLYDFLFEPVAYTAGIAWVISAFVVVMRFIDRAFNNKS